MLRPIPWGTGCGVDLSKLSIVPGKQCWVLYVDALVMNIDGNVLDTVSMAVKVGSRVKRSRVRGSFTKPSKKTNCTLSICHGRCLGGYHSSLQDTRQ